MLALSALVALTGRRRAAGAVCRRHPAYVLLAGYWRQSMNTLALVLLAVPMSVAAGFGSACWPYRGRGCAERSKSALDLMQTMPAFAYLIPLLLLFGFGPVVGLIASAIYATPPMVRNTLLGLIACRAPSRKPV